MPVAHKTKESLEQQVQQCLWRPLEGPAADLLMVPPAADLMKVLPAAHLLEVQPAAHLTKVQPAAHLLDFPPDAALMKGQAAAAAVAEGHT